MKSRWVFYNIVVTPEGGVEYLWQCLVCGTIVTNRFTDAPPEECETCLTLAAQEGE